MIIGYPQQNFGPLLLIIDFGHGINASSRTNVPFRFSRIFQNQRREGSLADLAHTQGEPHRDLSHLLKIDCRSSTDAYGVLSSHRCLSLAGSNLASVAKLLPTAERTSAPFELGIDLGMMR